MFILLTMNFCLKNNFYFKNGIYVFFKFVIVFCFCLLKYFLFHYRGFDVKMLVWVKMQVVIFSGICFIFLPNNDIFHFKITESLASRFSYFSWIVIVIILFTGQLTTIQPRKLAFYEKKSSLKTNNFMEIVISI